MKKYNWYKITTLTFAAIMQVAVMYHGIPAVLDNLAAYRLEGMTQDQARCIGKYRDMMQGLELE
jgi:hypothetical protein